MFCWQGTGLQYKQNTTVPPVTPTKREPPNNRKHQLRPATSLCVTPPPASNTPRRPHKRTPGHTDSGTPLPTQHISAPTVPTKNKLIEELVKLNTAEDQTKIMEMEQQTIEMATICETVNLLEYIPRQTPEPLGDH